MNISMDFQDHVNQLDSLRIVYFVDDDAFTKIEFGYDEMYSWYGTWEDVRKVANTLFETIIFTGKRRWLEAGCLFIDLCIRRAELEHSEGPFGTGSRAKLFGIEQDPSTPTLTWASPGSALTPV